MSNCPSVRIYLKREALLLHRKRYASWLESGKSDLSPGLDPAGFGSEPVLRPGLRFGLQPGLISCSLAVKTPPGKFRLRTRVKMSR